MGTISVSLPSDGSTADVSDYNTPITTIVDEFNGNIDNSNIKTGAAIATSKLAQDAGLNANSLNFASWLTATGLSSQVQSYTNTGSGGGTGYYINLAGIKLCWGSSGAFSTTAGNTYSFSLPTGFFTTVQTVTESIFGASGVPAYTGQGYSTSSATYFHGSPNLTNLHYSWFVVGT